MDNGDHVAKVVASGRVVLGLESHDGMRHSGVNGDAGHSTFDESSGESSGVRTPVGTGGDASSVEGRGRGRCGIATVVATESAEVLDAKLPHSITENREHLMQAEAALAAVLQEVRGALGLRRPA